MLAIDHVVVLVDDLDAAAQRFHDSYGLASLPGGRHVGHGTGNRVVPLGDSYLELIAVVDAHEAAASPFGSWVARRAETDEGPVALCLRTDDVEGVSQRTGHAPQAMSRRRPDGVELSWHLVALEAALTDGLPFFIRWDLASDDLPGRASVNHRHPFAGIAWVELGGDPDLLDAWLGPHQLPLRHVAGLPGPHRIGIAVTGAEPVVIG